MILADTPDLVFADPANTAWVETRSGGKKREEHETT